MRPMSAAFSCLVLLATATVALAAPPADDVIRQKIVGSWGDTPACAEGSLTFNQDGSFSSKAADGSDRVSGTYTIDGGRLSGKNGDNSMPVVLVDFDGEALLLDDGSGNPDRLARCQAAQ